MSCFNSFPKNNNKQIQSLSFYPLCHYFDQFSGEWPIHELRILLTLCVLGGDDVALYQNLLRHCSCNQHGGLKACFFLISSVMMSFMDAADTLWTILQVPLQIDQIIALNQQTDGRTRAHTPQWTERILNEFELSLQSFVSCLLKPPYMKRAKSWIS